MSYDFETTTHGKWILAGEHAVIRGHGALVFPVHEKKLTLRYDSSTHELHADYDGTSGADMHLLFWSVLEQGMQLLGKSLNSLNGHFHIQSNIPIGAGMGASAALCVAMSRWFAFQAMITETSVADFAKELEHLFHGKSSGLDIAGVANNAGIYFKQGSTTPIQQTWQPQWFLSSCGQIGITAHCINQVQAMWEENSSLATQIDQQMADSVLLAQRALQSSSIDGHGLLAQAINNAADCFQQWGLVSEGLHQHMLQLKEAGAVAVKPTGSGVGGFVISLWQSPPPCVIQKDLITLNP